MSSWGILASPRSSQQLGVLEALARGKRELVWLKAEVQVDGGGRSPKGFQRSVSSGSGLSSKIFGGWDQSSGRLGLKERVKD